MDWIARVTSIAALLIAGINLGVTLREKRRTLKVALRWGIDPAYHKTSGIVLWISVANVGRQPVVLNGAGLHVRGIPGALSAAKPLTNNQFPLALQPDNMFATSISSEVLLEMFRGLRRQGKVPMNAFVDTVFKEFRGPHITLDTTRLEELVARVKGNANYGRFKEFYRSVGSDLHMKSFDDLAQYLQTIAQQGFDIRQIPELSQDD